MAHVITDIGVDLGQITDKAALTYYKREPGYTIDGVVVPPLGTHYGTGPSTPAWQALTVYTAGQLAADPSTGVLIRRITAGTSRATFDATEQALWTEADILTPAQLAANSAFTATYAAGSATRIYVHPNGSDANTGLIDSKPKATIAAAVTAATAIPGAVVQLFPFVNYPQAAGDTYDLDVTKVRIHGHRSSLTWAAAPTAGYAVRLHATADYTATWQVWGRALDGVTIRGNINAPLAGDGLRVGHATDASNGDFAVANGGVEGFANDLAFISNAYRFRATNFNLRGATNSIYAPTGLSNFGENMAFTNCTIETAITVSSGEWHFHGCAIDNAELVIDGANVYLHGGHLENPGAASAVRFANVSNNGTLEIFGTAIVLNKPSGSDYTLAPFYSASTNTWGGITFIGCLLPPLGATAWFTPETTDGQHVLVGGTGRVTHRGCSFIDALFGNAYGVAAASNALRNGDFEAGTLAGWTTYGSQPANATADNTLHRTGSWSAKLAPGAGNSSGIQQQSVAVRPGEAVLCAAWVDLVSQGAGSSSSASMAWLAADGATQVGGTINFKNDFTVAGGWQFWSAAGVAPAGAAFVQVNFSANNASGNGVVFNVDDVMVTTV